MQKSVSNGTEVSTLGVAPYPSRFGARLQRHIAIVFSMSIALNGFAGFVAWRILPSAEFNLILGTLLGTCFLTLASFGSSRVIRLNTQQVEESLQEKGAEFSAQAAELARTELALLEKTRILQSVLDGVGEGLIATDEQGRILLWNPAAERILGQKESELPIDKWVRRYGLYAADGLTPCPSDQIPLVRALHGQTSSTQLMVRNPTLGDIWIEASAQPLKDGTGAVRGGVVAFRNVTENKAAEQRIHKLNDELEQRVGERTAQLEAANKELEAFTYSVSHDLRAPLRHISGFSKILIEDFGPSMTAEAAYYLHRIEEGTLRMGLLVDELLALARLGRHNLSLQVSGLNSIVQDVLSILQPEIVGRQVEWKINNLPSVECDPTLVRQVFQNLLANALKFSRTRSKAVIEVGHDTENGVPVIFIRDNGVGFSMKYSDKLFGVFQRLHRTEDFEGTGIGLATVQRIVQKHGGRVWAEAELDKGAVFHFTLSTIGQMNSLAGQEALEENHAALRS